jgi:hypothetical protein
LKFRQFIIKPIAFFFLAILVFSTSFNFFEHSYSLRPEKIDDVPDLLFKIEDTDFEVV